MEKKKKMDINPTTTDTCIQVGRYTCFIPEHHSFWREVPDITSFQVVHHCLVTLLNGKQLRALHVSASACFPVCRRSHSPPELLLLISPLAAMAEGVLVPLGCCPSTLPNHIDILVAEPFSIHSSGCMPTHVFVERGNLRLHTCYRNRSLGPHLALESVPAVFVALVGLPLCFGCWLHLGDLFHSVRGRGVWTPYPCVSTRMSGQGWLALPLFICKDAGAFPDLVNLSYDVMDDENPLSLIDVSYLTLFWAWL